MTQAYLNGFKNQKELGIIMSSNTFGFERVDLPGLWLSYVE